MLVEDRAHPVGGVDSPRALREFDNWFGSEAGCAEYLQRLRRLDGFRCPACGGTTAWLTARGQMYYASCQRQTSFTAGTIFEGTRKPLRLWFQAMWYVTSQKCGGSALGLQSVLGLGSYQTAWIWLHKMRRAMVRPGRDRLSGYVEVDETYVGGTEEGVHGRQTHKKAIVAIAIEVRSPKGFGRIRMQRVPDASAASLTPLVCDAVEPGSTVHTDGWKGYDDLPRQGYQREKTILSDRGVIQHTSPCPPCTRFPRC